MYSVKVIRIKINSLLACIGGCRKCLDNVSCKICDAEQSLYLQLDKTCANECPDSTYKD